MTTALLAKLSYETAVRTLELQERAVEQLRARTGTLLAASALSSSLFAARTAQQGGDFDAFRALAVIALTTSIVLCIYVLLPKSGFVFSLRAPSVYESLYGIARDEEEVHRALAYWLEAYWLLNQAKIDLLGRCFFAAAVTLILQLSFWSLSLAANIA